MSDDRLHRLSEIEVPAPSPEARRRAVEAALLAFDAAAAEKSTPPAQGTGWAARLRSIVIGKRGISIMNTRLTYGLGTAAVALLLLPLGYQLYSTTSLTPPVGPTIPGPVAVDQPVVTPTVADTPPVTGTTTGPAAPLTTAETPVEQLMQSDEERERDQLATRKVQTIEITPQRPLADAQAAAGGEAARPDDAAQPLGAIAPKPAMRQNATVTASPPAPGQLAVESGMLAGRSAQPVDNMAVAQSASQLATEAAMPAPSIAAAPPMGGYAGTPAPGATQPSGDQFTHFSESPVKVVAEQPVSTFSIDVDTASYSYVRNALGNGWLPEPDAVRLEELINYFDYAYAAPESADMPFKPSVAVFPTPWNPGTELIQIGIKGYVPPAAEHKPANLVFLIDTSGSMDEPDKLPLLKRAFALLVDQLDRADTVSIVVYAGSAGVVLEPTKASQKARILSALDHLEAGGSTAGAEGIELAYRLAEQNRVSDGVNRVILATDGDFNVGIDDPEDLKTFIKQKRDSGVFLSVLGFGQGNLGDDTMQALAQNGNGNAAYIDSFKEAQKVLVQQAGGTLETIAKDVKIQVEFNPAFVSEYRLIGYETRALNREDFNNDKVDAGDIGAGTTVTALYEIVPAGSSGNLVDPLRYGNGAAVDAQAAPAAPIATDELAYLKMRFKLPDSDTSQLIDLPITRSLSVGTLAAVGDDQRFAAAVAAFGQKLKGSNYGDMRWDDIRSLAQGARGADVNGYRAEFMQLIDAAAVLMPDPLCTAPEGNRNCR